MRSKTKVLGKKCCREKVEEEFRRINPEVPLEEVREDLTSRCMDRWLILDRQEKIFFSKQSFSPRPPCRDGSTKKRRSRRNSDRPRRDPDRPKRAMTAYIYFCKEQRRLLSQSGLKLPLGDITREIAKRWKQVSPEQRQHFEQLAAADKQRYRDEMEAFRKRRISTVDETTLSLLHKVRAENNDFDDDLMIGF
ncbi:non-histone chromosomal protein 6 isoform X2 [Galendromus occidentalis]|uniref:Non-histone chromosomal protein 6 isoform X2 n=1 Tax=Galendromus occidentalis TaxID=34638 RepID=A0AAJ6VYQ4_9ACAR|nr:non-histone chromosomal protein 6 isoform X2 [Galendromus occidentalis]